jgi:hypothetical protein
MDGWIGFSAWLRLALRPGAQGQPMLLAWAVDAFQSPHKQHEEKRNATPDLFNTDFTLKCSWHATV